MKSKLLIGLLLIAFNVYSQAENRPANKYAMFVIANKDDQTLINAVNNNQILYNQTQRPTIALFAMRNQLSRIINRKDIEEMKAIEIDYVSIANETSLKEMVEYILSYTPFIICITGIENDNKIVDDFIAQLAQTSKEHIAVAI